MPRKLGSIVALAAALTTGAATALPAQALTPVPLPGSGAQFFAWSNYEAPEEADARSAVENYYLCVGPAVIPTVSASEAAAITRGLNVLATIEGSADIRKITSVLAKKSLQIHEETLGALGLSGRLGGAGAVSLLMAKKSKDRRHLVNAAAIMLHFDRLPEAYDLLTWADRRKAGSDPDGNFESAYQSAWAETLLRLGRTTEAQQRFEAAATANPLATTPRLGVARALACAGDYDAAARWWARGQRSLDLADPFEETPPEPSASRVQPRWKMILVEPLIDPSQGIGGAKFESFEPPESANVPDTYFYEAYNFYSKALEDLDSYFPDPVRMTWIQRAIVRYAIRLTETDRSVGITKDLISVQLRNVVEAADNGEDDLGCGAADNYGSFWGATRRLYELHQDLADRYHQIYTAAAKQVSSKPVNEHLNGLADEMVYRAYLDFVELLGGAAQLNGDNVTAHATWAAIRVRANDAARADDLPLPYPECESSFNDYATGAFEGPAEPGDPGSGGPCNNLTKGLNLKMGIDGKLLKKLPISLEVKANCESVSAEVKGPPLGIPLATLTGFLSYEDNFVENQVEIFGGVKGSYGLSDLGADVNVGISFLYGMGEDGPEIIDVRIKSETSISVTDGPKSFETKKSLGYSFVTGKLI